MKKKSFLAMALLLVCAVVFAGGTSESTDSGITDLRMSWWGGDGRHTPTLAVLDNYMAANPSVHVEGEYQGWDGYYQKLVTQLAGGTSADLMQIDQPWLAELCSKGDVLAEIDENIVDVSQFDAAFLDNFCRNNGKLVGIPTGINVATLLVDESLLEKSGIDPETVWTWENIVTEGRKVHEANPECYFNNAAPDVMVFWFEIYMAQLAGGVVDNDKNILFTEAQGTQAFEYFKQWFDYNIVEPFAQTSLYFQKGETNPTWVNGNAAAAWNWVSNVSYVRGFNKNKENTDTRQIPVMDGAKNTGVLMRPSQIYVVSNNSKSIEDSMKLMNYLLNDTEAVTTLGTCRGVPASASARDTLTAAGKITALEQKATNEGIAQAGLPQSTWQTNSEVRQAMQDVMDEFGYGLLTPAEASAKLIKSLGDTLARL